MPPNATNIEVIFGVSTCCLAWSSLYLILCYLQPQYPKEWHCRLVTMIHATTIVGLSAWCSFVQGPWPFTDPGGPNTPLQEFTVIICLGYFIFDFAWCLYNRTEGLLMMVHHVVCIVGISTCLYVGYSGTELAGAIFASEFTNPLLQIRWFLHETNRKTLLIAKITEILFAFSFGFLRVIVGTYFVYCYFSHPRPGLLGRTALVSLYVVSLCFWFSICRLMFRRLTQGYNYKKKPSLVTENNNPQVTNSGTKHE